MTMFSMMPSKDHASILGILSDFTRQEFQMTFSSLYLLDQSFFPLFWGERVSGLNLVPMLCQAGAAPLSYISVPLDVFVLFISNKISASNLTSFLHSTCRMYSLDQAFSSHTGSWKQQNAGGDLLVSVPVSPSDLEPTPLPCPLAPGQQRHQVSEAPW